MPKNDHERLLSLIEREFDLELLLKLRELKEIEGEMQRGEELRSLVEKLILNEYTYLGNNNSTGDSIDNVNGRLSAPPSFGTQQQQRQQQPASSSGHDRRAARQAAEAFLTASAMPAQQQQLHHSHSHQPSPQTIQYDILPDGTVVKMVCPVCGAERFRSMLGFVNHCRLQCRLSFGSHDERLERCGVPVPEWEIPEHLRQLSSQATRELELVQLRAEVQPVKIVKDEVPIVREFEEAVIDVQSFGLLPERMSVDAAAAATSRQSSSMSSALRPTERQQQRSWIDGESRYYVKRKLLVGNAAKCILKQAHTLPKESIMVGGGGGGGGGRPGTHLFKLYLKDLSTDAPLLPFVKFVRVFLHPAYRPDDIVTLHEQPFTLERPAWGEFPVRIQLHFHDAARNKPVDLYHQLSIFAATDARYIEGGQSLHEIDLDKRTVAGVGGCNAVDPGGDNSRNNPAAAAAAAASSAQDDDVIYVSESESSSGDEALSTLNAFTPVQEVINPHYLKYCKYCGLPHHPQTSFGILQKNCAMKPRKIRVSSRSVPWGLFNNGDETGGSGDKEDKCSAEGGGYFGNDADKNAPLNESASNEEKLVAAVASQLDLSSLQVPTISATVMMLAATRIFMKRLLEAAASNVPSPAQRAILDQNLPAVLTPVHLYNAITSRAEFDFLSNAHFSATSPSASVNTTNGPGSSANINSNVNSNINANVSANYGNNNSSNSNNVQRPSQ